MYMQGYLPEVGHSIDAQRKVKSKEFPNRIVGPVVERWDDSCRVLNNAGESNEGDFKLYFSDWYFCFLHYTRK